MMGISQMNSISMLKILEEKFKLKNIGWLSRSVFDIWLLIISWCIWKFQKDLFVILQTRSISLFYQSWLFLGCNAENDWHKTWIDEWYGCFSFSILRKKNWLIIMHLIIKKDHCSKQNTPRVLFPSALPRSYNSVCDDTMCFRHIIETIKISLPWHRFGFWSHFLSDAPEPPSAILLFDHINL